MMRPLCSTFAIATLAVSARAQCSLTGVTPAVHASGDMFGRAVAIDGSTALVGAPDASPQGGFSGAAYIFERTANSWAEAQVLLPSDSSPNDGFGFACAVDGDRLVVSAPYKDVFSNAFGAVYVFEHSGLGWLQAAKLVTPLLPMNTSAQGLFGWSVDIEGDRALIGMPGHWTPGGSGSAGAAFIFERSPVGWVRTARLIADQPILFHRLGFAVALSGDIALVSTPDPAFGGANNAGVGAALVFEKVGSDWFQTASLIASLGQYGDRAGRSIDLVGNRAYVGAPASDAAAYIGGAVFVFEKGASGWAELTYLTSPQPVEFGGFGYEVAATEEHLVVTGSAVHTFSTHNWQWQSTQVTPLASFFGIDVAVSGDRVAFGTLSEKAFFGDLVGETRFCQALPNSTGGVAMLEAWGCSSLSANELTLRAGPVAAGQAGLFYYGPSEASVPFGDGRRCVTGAPGEVHRIPALAVAGPAGFMQLQVATALATTVLPGSTWKFQAIYRDPAAGMSGVNLSDGLSIEFEQ